MGAPILVRVMPVGGEDETLLRFPEWSERQGERLRDRRLLLRLTRREVSMRTGLHLDQVCDLERGALTFSTDVDRDGYCAAVERDRS